MTSALRVAASESATTVDISNASATRNPRVDANSDFMQGP